MAIRRTMAQRLLALALVTLSAVAGAVTAAAAQSCPQDLCTCLGSLGSFAVVADEMEARPSKVGDGAYSYNIGTSIDGDVCAGFGRFVGTDGGESEVDGDVLLLAGSGQRAAKFKGFRTNRLPQAGTDIIGDLATAGGILIGSDYVHAASISTDGTHDRLAECQQAQGSMLTVSNTLRALTPTQNVDAIVLNSGESFTINATAGANVINIASIVLKGRTAYYGFSIGSTLIINLAPDTDSVILNVAGRLSIGRGSFLQVAGGSADDVLVNVYASSGSVKLDQEAVSTIAILAPNMRVVSSRGAEAANLFAKKVSLRASYPGNQLVCL